MKGFFPELQRRNVYKVAVAYAVVGWLAVQVATQVSPFLQIPQWIVRLVILAVAIGFPVALVIAWAFELTPEGIKRTEDVDSAAAPRANNHAWIFIALIGAAVSFGLFFVGRYTAHITDAASSNDLPAKSIAILPFDNLSRDPDNAYFAEGVQDEILTRLAAVADLKVISHTSTQRFKSAPSDLRDIARQLGVRNILEGSVQKSNDQVRVNVQLINALSDAHLWADTYDRKLVDIFSVETEIAKTIADRLQAKLTGSEKQLIAAQSTSDTTAYELYHKGLMLWERRSGDNLPKAIEYYEQAIARDPNYALAYAALAEAYIVAPGYTAMAPRDASKHARDAALRALQLDENLGEAHTALANILCLDSMDFPGSTAEFRRAINLNPNDATAHHWYGSGPLVATGQFDQAVAELKRAAELDPLSGVIQADVGTTFMYARRYPEAIAAFQKALAIDPAFYYTHYNLAVVLHLSGDAKGAAREFTKARELNDDPLLAALEAATQAQNGARDNALSVLQQLEQLSQHRYVAAYARALLYTALANKDEAVRWLEQSYLDRDGGSVGFIKVDPMMDSLHGDPRFEALVEKVFAPKQ
ncbi:MAG: tetratricopeptide repeat protein [Chthoniobacterales bacterium]